MLFSFVWHPLYAAFVCWLTTTVPCQAELAEALIRTSCDPYPHNRVAKVRLRLEMEGQKA